MDNNQKIAEARQNHENEESKIALAKKKAEEKKKKEEEEKKKKILIKPKFYYDVKVECLLPATLTYRVLAENPEQALTMIKGLSPNSVKHKLIGRKELKVMVYDAGSTFMKLLKNLVGR